MSSSKPASRLSRKRLGEWAEVRFTDAALLRGLAAIRPYGDSDRFDQIVISPRPHRFRLSNHTITQALNHPILSALLRFFRDRPKISRVQIRATRQFRDNRYEVCVQHTRGRYTIRDADFLAAYVVPLDVWYIIPISAITSRTKIHLAPHRPNNLYCEPFREAWHLLM